MTNSYIDKIDEFLIAQGISEIPETLKQKRAVLKDIVSDRKLDLDLLELDYNNGMTKCSQEEYVTRIQNLEINKYQAIGYIQAIKIIQKEDRKLKRKQTFQKVKRIFVK